MDALINWAGAFVAAHPKVVAWLLVVLTVDQGLKTLKGAFKLNIDDNVFDTIGNIIGQILSKAQGPKQ